jgi:branched-chain amino acid transport system substrate-binding protein
MRLVGITLAAALAVGGLCCQDSDSIKVGLIVPLTGDVKTFGESMRNGALMAFEEVNAGGGIHGRQLQVLVRDDGNDPEQTARAGRELVHGEEVVVMLGSVSTDCTIPLADICQSAGVPLVVATSTNPQVTVTADGTRRDYVFRACFTDSFQGAVAARFARTTMGSRHAAVLFNGGDEYSRGLAGFFRAAYEAAGGQVAVYESYAPGDTGLTRLLEIVRAGKPDLLFLPDYYSRVAKIARRAREMGLGLALLGGDGWDSPKMPQLGGDAIIGGYFTNHFAPDDPRPEVTAWVQKYQAKYGQKPDALATLGYDAAALLVEALRRAPKPGPKAARDALAGVRRFPGVTGTISFDERGNAVKNVVVAQYAADGPRFVMTERP